MASIVGVTPGTTTISYSYTENGITLNTENSITVTKRDPGISPTFPSNGNYSLTVKCAKNGLGGSVTTTNSYTAASPGHGGSISYSVESAGVGDNNTGLTGWNTNILRRIIVPANTLPGTYTVRVKAKEAATTTDGISYQYRDIKVVVEKNIPTLYLLLTFTVTYPNADSFTVSGSDGELGLNPTNSVYFNASASSSTVTITPKKYTDGETLTINVGATDYLYSTSGQITVKVNRGDPPAPVFYGSLNVSATYNTSAANTGAFSAATPGYEGGTITYELISVVANGTTTELTGWTLNSSTRVITIPAKTNVGTYKATVRAKTTQTDQWNESAPTDAIVTVTINRRTPSLIFHANSGGITYDGTTQDIGYVGYIGDGTASYIVSTSSTVPEASASGWTPISGTIFHIYSSAATATTYYVFLKSTSGTNYNAVSPKSGGSKVIDKRNVTITGKSQTVKYESSPVTAVTTSNWNTYVDATNIGLVSGHSISCSLEAKTTSGTAYTTSVHAGTTGYYMVPVNNSIHIWSGSNEVTSNYNISIPAISSNGSLTINKATNASVTVNLNNNSLIYNGSSQNIVINVMTHGCNAHIGFGTSATSAPTSWTRVTSTVKTLSATDSGVYFVWYKFEPDTDHDNSSTGTYVGSKVIGKAAGNVSYTATNDSCWCTSTAYAMSSTDGAKTLTVSSAGASSSTNGSATCSNPTVTKGGTSYTGWTITSNGKTLTVPANTAAGTYSVAITATAPQTTNYNSATTTKTITVTVNAVTLESISLSLTKTTIKYNETTTPTVMAHYNNGSTDRDVTSELSVSAYSFDPINIAVVES